MSYNIDTIGDLDKIRHASARSRRPLCKPDSWLRIVGIKTFLTAAC